MREKFNAKQYTALYVTASFVLAVILIYFDSDYANELLFLHIPFVVWSAHIFSNRIYILLILLSILNCLIVMHTLFNGNSLVQSYQSLIMSTVCTIIICEMLFRSSQEKRKLDDRNKKLILELQLALTQVKSLKGMLPICSYCNKVRDDEGSWSRIEVYIRDHSEVDFTHSMCPECFERELEIINKKSKTKNSG